MIRQSDGVSLSALIKPENVIYIEGKPSKEEVLRALTARMQPQVDGVIGAKALADRVAEVEKLNHVLESGFYIPHAKFPELDAFHGVLALVPQGFTDPATGQVVKAALLLLSPHRPAFFQRHLNMLSLLSQTFQPEFIDKLAGLNDGGTAAALLASR